MDAMKKAWLSERSFLICCVVLGAVQAWICRYPRIPDGVSYLDIGDAYFRGDWAAAINAYWSPMYSWWLGLALYVLKPSVSRELITVEVVNFIIYLVALFSFRFFIHSVLRERERDGATVDSVALNDCAFLALGYGLFLWCSLVLIDIGGVHPDLLLAAIVFLIAGFLVDLQAHQSYWKFAMFGALNGMAYLTKSIMFPLGFGFLAILLFSGKLSKRRIQGVALSAAAFLIVCSPFIVALSHAKGRFTFGDAGKIAYASLVSPGAPQKHWQGEAKGSGTPHHATRELLKDPPVFEFADPVPGTYPVWDDPSYWNEGLQWTFRPRSQIRVLLQSALAYEKMLLGEAELLAGVLIFLFLGGEATRKAIASRWPLLAMAFLGILAYSFVLVETRYVGAALVLLFVAIFAGIRLPNDMRMESVAKYVAAAVVATVLLSVVGQIAESVYTNLAVGSDPSGRDEIRAALGLEAMGLRAGDKVAVVGYGITNHWARLARFKIVAEAAPGPLAIQKFWASPGEKRDLAYEYLKHTGAKAVVAWDPPSTGLDPRWKSISDTNYYVYFFSK